ncbi:PIG-L family deacetylase [Pseudoprevotella muciniphila]|uniref:PIG-L family deacetylase n=1 Tax=Pseudoprevotella muciniphila TaxID=2133944 RepID=A0A5P8E8Z4_9BACT|nr:PIG-L deacetylase family protein [Pseudoprevotella muciniphila]QFQ13412.1 PIG-L family deacetylase [Pseudoprevotella muciniphila]
MKNFIRYIRIYVIRLLARILGKSGDIGDNILLIAPHPDDEIIGCGGLIQRYTPGKCVNVVILTGGGASHHGCCDTSADDIKRERRNMAQRINAEIGLPKGCLHLLDFEDGNISTGDSVQEAKLLKIIQEVQPDAILFPIQQGEGWSDHIAAGDIVKRLISAHSIKVQLYEYCVWFWYYNVWNIRWRDARVLKMTSEQYQKKLKAISDYTTSVAPCGKPWSGVLPKVFLKANSWSMELFFKVEK